MSFQNREIAALTPDSVSTMEARINAEKQTIERIIDPTHPEYQNYLKLSAEAQSTISRGQLAMQMGQGELALQSLQNLQDIYKAIVPIREQMVLRNMGQTTSLGGLSLPLQMDVFRETPVGQSTMGQKAIQGLEKMSSMLLANPEDFSTPQEFSKNSFFLRSPNSVAVDFAKLNATEKALKQFESARIPGMEGTISSLRSGLNSLRAVDPIRSGWNDFHQRLEGMRGTTNLRPLRILGFLGSGLLATFGLGVSIVTKQAPTWPTYMWGGITALTLNPKLARNFTSDGPTLNALDAARKLQEPSIQYLFRPGAFSGDIGAQAIGEMQALKQSNALRPLLKQDGVNMAQLQHIAADSPALLQAMRGLSSDSERKQALQTLATANQDQSDFMGEMVRIKPLVRPSIGFTV